MYSNNIKQEFEELKLHYSDIYEHLDTLKCYGEMCSHITEFGMRHGVSSVAFLMAQPKKSRLHAVLGAYLTLVYVIGIMSTMKKYNLYLPERQIRELEKISERLGISVSEIIRRALDSFIETENLKLETDTLIRKDVARYDNPN